MQSKSNKFNKELNQNPKCGEKVFALGVTRKFGELIAEAERRIINEVRDGKLETEPSITDRFLASQKANLGLKRETMAS